MRKLFFLFILPLAVSANAQFGYYSTSRVLEELPRYAQATLDYERLCQRCEKEIDHNEKELTRQYVAFLDGYREFPEPILRKRQSELQRLVDGSIDFRKQLKHWLAEAKDSLYAPSYQDVDKAVARICQACELDYAIDSDVLAYRYINPAKGVDITRMAIDAALYPDKPVNMLDGYDDFVKRYRPVEPEVVPESTETLFPLEGEGGNVPAAATDSIAVTTTGTAVVAADSIAVQQQTLSNDTIQ